MSEPDETVKLEALPIDSHPGKYVIFRLAHGEFGIVVRRVSEILDMLEITVVPRSPVFIAGVINLRGNVIPVVDLRRTFELPGDIQTGRSCIMIVKALLVSREQMIGIVVDEVLEVCSFESSDFLHVEDLENIPKLGSGAPEPYITGIARTDGKVRLLLDIDEVLINLDLHGVEALPAAA